MSEPAAAAPDGEPPAEPEPKRRRRRKKERSSLKPLLRLLPYFRPYAFKIVALLVVTLSFALAGCDPDAGTTPTGPGAGGDPAAAEAGTLRVVIHDAPVDDVDEVWVVIDEVSVHHADQGWFVIDKDGCSIEACTGEIAHEDVVDRHTRQVDVIGEKDLVIRARHSPALSNALIVECDSQCQ